ncbi:hypothetical protein QTP70_025823, partial [Hemibagrus guttatus]
DVEYRLQQCNLAYLKDNTYLKLTEEIKHEILEKLAETMFSFKAYPTNDDYAQVAAALVSEHHNTILDVPVGISFEDTDLQPSNSLHLTSSIGIILEGQVVMDKMQDLLQAMCLLFGLIYALDLNYPKSLANTFDFIQHVIMSIGQNAQA